MTTIWWIWQRLLWAILPLPQNLKEREIAIADRAALVLDKHLTAIRNQLYKLDPYATKGPKFWAHNPRDGRLLRTAIARTEIALRGHPLPGHLMNALLRDRDPETVARSKKIAEEMAKEAHENERRSHPTIPPPPPAPAKGAGGSKETGP